MKPLVVTIDGNIGSGKSTIIDKLKQNILMISQI